MILVYIFYASLTPVEKMIRFQLSLVLPLDGRTLSSEVIINCV